MFPKAIFLVLPNQFRIAEQSSQDNAYMQPGTADAELALRQVLNLAEQLRQHSHTVVVFPGVQSAPDGVFPNNVFATIRGRVIIGAMRHGVRQIEALRADLRQFFAELLGYAVHDLSYLIDQQHYAELTGSLVIDRFQGIGFCGLGERCTPTGANAMQTAFQLERMLRFDLAPGEYHANVIMSALGGRGILLCRSGFADPSAADQIAACYPAEQVIWIDETEKANYVGNCIALAPDQIWMSARAKASLKPATQAAIAKLGFDVLGVDLSEIEKAGGSLRCMIGEVY